MALFSRGPHEYWLKPHFSKNEVAKSGISCRPECMLDVLVPKGVTNFPTVVWFHGGASAADLV